VDLEGTEKKAFLQEWLRSVESLRDCPDWGQDELPIEILRTHISVLLLSKRRVLKLKKPLDLGFLDYTTIEKRRQACQAEVELNNRLCPVVLRESFGSPTVGRWSSTAL
jgi:aminoglycoside phosphotransferase family enzyme